MESHNGSGPVSFLEYTVGSQHLVGSEESENWNAHAHPRVSFGTSSVAAGLRETHRGEVGSKNTSQIHTMMSVTKICLPKHPKRFQQSWFGKMRSSHLQPSSLKDSMFVRGGCVWVSVCCFSPCFRESGQPGAATTRPCYHFIFILITNNNKWLQSWIFTICNLIIMIIISILLIKQSCHYYWPGFFSHGGTFFAE